MKPIINEVGNIYSKLTVLSFSHINSDKKACFVCQCQCGNQVTVSGKSLRNGNTKSCGCTRNEKIGLLNKTHGDCSGGKTPEYFIWRSMVDRCENQNNKKYHNYGGRGIKVCDRWRNNYAFFLEDMGRRPELCPTIERRDTDGNYEPSNCRWATWKEQQNNRSNNRKITAFGITQNLSQWADQVGTKYCTLLMRLRRGWTPEEAIAGMRCQNAENGLKTLF